MGKPNYKMLKKKQVFQVHYDKGYKVGYEDGVKSGFRKGGTDGLNEGIAKGKQKIITIIESYSLKERLIFLFNGRFNNQSN